MTTPERSSSSKFLLFLGCAIPYRVSSYEISTRKVLAKLGIELVEMPEYNCCGLPIDPINHEMMLTLAARNLCLAEQQGLNIVALCPGCAGTLRKVNKKLKEDKGLKEKINGYLKETGLEFKGTIEAKHLLQLLVEDVGLEKIKNVVKKPLTNVQVTEHSGCHVSRPVEGVGFDDPENPETLKKLIEATDDAQIEPKDNAAASMGSFSFTGGAIVGSGVTFAPSGNNTFVAGDVLSFDNSKVTPGGIVLMSIEILKS